MKVHRVSVQNKIFRLIWNLVWLLFASWTPVFMHKWRIIILRLFGGRACFSCSIYPDVKIWNPRNLTMERKSALGPGVQCYNVDQIQIGRYATISQRTYLCSASHDFDQLVVTDNIMDLIVGPIEVQDFAWVAAEAFVGPNTTIRRGSVVLARSVVTKDTSDMGVFGGNPMKFIRVRKSSLPKHVQ